MTQEFEMDILERIIGLCNEMLELADQGDAERSDERCGALYGVLRDDAYKLRRMATEEIEKRKEENPATARKR